MSTSSLFWLILYGISAILFFSVASAITFFGIRDMRDLLSKSNKEKADKSRNVNSNPNE